MTREFDQKLEDLKENNAREHESICSELKLIRENHLAHIEKSMNSIENQMIVIDTNQKWQMKFFWIITGAVLSSLVVAVLGIILKT